MQKFILYVISFLTGVVWGFTGALFIDQNLTDRNTFVLSYQTQIPITPTPPLSTSSFPEISNLPIPTPTFTPILSPTPIKTPTPSPHQAKAVLTLTPKLTPTPTPIVNPIVVPSHLEVFFSEFSSRYNVDKAFLAKIADCESHFNPGVNAEPYAGMFQFTEGTWYTYRNKMGEDPNKDLRFGAREAIQTAAYALSLGHTHLWPACSR